MNFLCETLLLLFFCVTGGLAIQCYECNSRYDRSCGDKFSRTAVGMVDCDLKLKGPHLDNMNSTVCRKIVHHIRGHQRIVRSCGWVDDKEVMAGRDCMRKAGTYEVMLYYCSCYDDFCNSANDHKMSLLLLVTAAISWLLHMRA
ncbi:protein quiver-like [Amphibalanus amphitrite]|uniref:protein quiver-like n=1 Tax=Amphibalanus amphitrite TaxID=1232801 RepID=UPI001C923AFE|nr:protein quiver-like [Amphibalanus amphitrite]